MSDTARLEEARALLASGANGRALALAREIVDRDPDLIDGHELLAQSLEAIGDKAGAEKALRATLASHPGAVAIATRLASLITPRRGAAEAAAMLEPLAASPQADTAFFTALGLALKTAGRKEDAVAAYDRAATLAPQSAVAQHNLAGALGDAQRYPESLTATRRAFEMGLDAPETWLVHGRSLIGLGDYDEGEAALREALRRRESYGEALAELAQLIWMRTEDLAAATEALDQALTRSPDDVELSLAKARLLEYASDAESAYSALSSALEKRAGDVRLQVAASLLAVNFDADRAMAHAKRAYAMAPAYGPAAAALCQANLAMGRAAEAAALAEDLMRDWPLDQHPVTLAATAWRILGDGRYASLYDYERLVFRQTIATPAGWPTLEAYLGDLASSLKDLQRLRGHPVGQSLRHGSQTSQSLAGSDDPAIKAFFAAIDAPIRAYIAKLSERADVLGRRVTAGYRFSGAWSALLRPGGHHVDHIHPLGWISSAFHVGLPDAVEDGRQGWLKFGEPGVVTSPVLGPEKFLKPQAGDLVLFPSYMWHGTVAFSGDEPRLAIAFDVLPA
ncbi:MAG TPA: putative 2OG-Fe(II) oxygenase [Caulobacteraceae bacterium]